MSPFQHADGLVSWVGFVPRSSARPRMGSRSSGFGIRRRAANAPSHSAASRSASPARILHWRTPSHSRFQVVSDHVHQLLRGRLAGAETVEYGGRRGSQNSGFLTALDPEDHLDA